MIKDDILKPAETALSLTVDICHVKLWLHPESITFLSSRCSSSHRRHERKRKMDRSKHSHRLLQLQAHSAYVTPISDRVKQHQPQNPLTHCPPNCQLVPNHFHTLASHTIRPYHTARIFCILGIFRKKIHV
jgi:hypothetical protein